MTTFSSEALQLLIHMRGKFTSSLEKIAEQLRIRGGRDCVESKDLKEAWQIFCKGDKLRK
jgi:histone H3/H4